MRSNSGAWTDASAAQSLQEALRRRYRPAQVRLLFIGEAPPASGRFFYQADSGLYRAILDSFRAVLPSISEADFLSEFQSAGCYLIDVCPYPVDRFVQPARRAACAASEPLLSRQINELQPQSIATVVRSIRGNVERAARLAGWHGPRLDLPYPGRWSRHHDVFLKKLVPELSLITKALLRPNLTSDN
jgi:hypothetical protein